MKSLNWWLGWLVALSLGFGAVSEAMADSEYVDGIRWTYTVAGGKAEVSGVPTSTTGAIVIPSMLGGHPVTSIGSSAFYNCSGLTSVTIPDSVTSIGHYAFGSCSGLTSVTIGNSVTSIGYGVFTGCTNLTSVTIGDSVTSIGSSAFSGCTNLTAVFIHDLAAWCGIEFESTPLSYAHHLYLDGEEVAGDLVIPDSVTSIGSSVFYNCSGLTSVTIPDSVTSIGGSAFSHCSGLTSVTIPNSVTSIGTFAFSGCSGLTSVTIPDSVTSIGYYAFEDCSGLAWTILPESVTNIGFHAFLSCSSLKVLYVPEAWRETDMLASAGVPQGCTVMYGGAMEVIDGVLWAFLKKGQEATVFAMSGLLDDVLAVPPVLGGCTVTGVEAAFEGFTNVTRVVLPTTVTNIAPDAFRGCAGVVSAVIPQCVCTSRLSEVFPDSYRGIADIEICEGVEFIGEGAFSGCAALESITIPGSVTSIGACAFDRCSSLAAVSIPQGVSGIENGTFRGCEMLRSVDIPYGVARIGDEAFKGCVSLAGVFLPEGIVYIGVGAFAGCSALAVAEIPDGMECIGEEAFEGCATLASIHLPESLVDWGLRSLPPAMQQELKDGTDGFLIINGWVLWYSDSEVSTLELPAGVVGVGNHALADFWDLESVEMPESLKYIGRGAFETNTYLDNVVIPGGVEWVRDGAFQGCSYIRELYIGKNVGHIGRRAFAGCTQLATVEVPESVAEIGDAAFSNCWRMLSVKLPLGLEVTGTGIFAGCQSLTGVTMPTHAFTAAQLFEERYAALESVTVAGGETVLCDEVFKNCTALASVTLPEGVEEIGPAAFAGCRSLPGIEMPGTVTGIGEGAFEGCSALRAIVLPDSVEELGARAFKNCGSLENATLSRSLKAMPDEVFAGCIRLASMVVPASVKRIGRGVGGYFQGLYYLGNAPEYDADAYTPRYISLTTYVVQGSRGWDGSPSSRDLPPSWIGNPITFWTPNRFDAHFDANGGVFVDGSAVWSCEQITGVGYVLPPYAPTLAGAEFDGWWTDPVEGAQIKATTQVNETREITFYAHWKGTPVPVTVRFNANGGTVVPEEGTYMATMPYGELPVPTRVHYRFDGWWTAAEGGNKVVSTSRVPGADQELFAHWTPQTYAIRFHSNGGEGEMADQSFTYGNPVTLHANAFQRGGWEFNGWALAEDGVPVYADGAVFAQVAAVEDGVIHLYAMWWRGGSYAVRFDANGGTGRMDNQTFELGEEKALSPCQFSREGCQFLGWATLSSGEVVYEDEAVVSDLATEPDATVVLYAVWEELPEPEPLPEITDDAEVAGILANAADPRLAIHIQTTAAYAEFREWALAVNGSNGGELAGAETVLESLHAWPAYLLGSSTLFENEPDIRLASVEMKTSNGVRATPATMTVRVFVRDGTTIVTIDANKVAALFVATDNLRDWAGDARPVSELISTEQDGTMTFAVQATGETSAFLGIRE